MQVGGEKRAEKERGGGDRKAGAGRKGRSVGGKPSKARETPLPLPMAAGPAGCRKAGGSGIDTV